MSNKPFAITDIKLSKKELSYRLKTPIIYILDNKGERISQNGFDLYFYFEEWETKKGWRPNFELSQQYDLDRFLRIHFGDYMLKKEILKQLKSAINLKFNWVTTLNNPVW